ncbi:hypothetical protein BD289DRAFT_486662 [Coniella lustricola]|nr:hypothetical protein BD289DRAFT_486662 [Coniella lustricola]
MSMLITDHRRANVGGVEFGVGGCTGVAHRFLNGENVAANMTLVYPDLWKGDNKNKTGEEAGEDEPGTIWSIAMEKEIVPVLLADEEWKEFMEFRGYDSL